MTTQELREMVQGRPAGHGECDGCHKDGLSLWELPDEPSGRAWMYCLDCMGRIIRQMERNDKRHGEG